MKILIVGFTKLKYMPYAKFYLDNINAEENQIHLLYWNRDLREEDKSGFEKVNLHEYGCFQQDDVPKTKKVKGFLGFRKFAKKLIKQEDFDFIIVLHTLPAVLLKNTLLRGFKNKFILDYRDSTYEGFKPFKDTVAKLAHAAVCTFVSSDGFRRFLPADCGDKIFTSHNIILDSLNHRDYPRQRSEDEPVKIAFWGMLRDETLNCKLIESVADDARFELHFYGREQLTAENLKAYAAESAITNVYFHGEYAPEDRYDFARKTDIIHNLYNNGNAMLAMGNKYYDGVIFRLPQLVMTNSYMGLRATAAGVGFECNPYELDFADNVYEYFKNIDREQLIKSCDDECEKVVAEFYLGAKKIKDIISAFDKSRSNKKIQ